MLRSYGCRATWAFSRVVGGQSNNRHRTRFIIPSNRCPNRQRLFAYQLNGELLVATTPKSVTKAALSSFVRDKTTLNLTQSKTLTEQLLAEYSITPKPPADPYRVPVEVGQRWLHAATGRVVRVTDVEMGPQYTPNDPVTAWGPESVSWQDTADPGTTGIAQITTWRAQMTPVESPDITDKPAESVDQP